MRTRERANVVTLDLAEVPLREVNGVLQAATAGVYRVRHPRGVHALACGLKAPVEVEVEGHTGYYTAGMNQHARVVVHGSVGVGVAENMMSGEVRVMGDASQSAGATAHGGLLVIEGNASARCGIALKGADIVVKGNVGHMCCFLAQAGRVVVLGDAGEALGDSLYEARIYVRGRVKGLGADCVEKALRPEHLEELEGLLARAGCEGVDPASLRRYGSARGLYHFKTDNAAAY